MTLDVLQIINVVSNRMYFYDLCSMKANFSDVFMPCKSPLCSLAQFSICKHVSYVSFYFQSQKDAASTTQLAHQLRPLRVQRAQRLLYSARVQRKSNETKRNQWIFVILVFFVSICYYRKKSVENRKSTWINARRWRKSVASWTAR